LLNDECLCHFIANHQQAEIREKDISSCKKGEGGYHDFIEFLWTVANVHNGQDHSDTFIAVAGKTDHAPVFSCVYHLQIIAKALLRSSIDHIDHDDNDIG